MHARDAGLTGHGRLARLLNSNNLPSRSDSKALEVRAFRQGAFIASAARLARQPVNLRRERAFPEFNRFVCLVMFYALPASRLVRLSYRLQSCHFRPLQRPAWSHSPPLGRRDADQGTDLSFRFLSYGDPGLVVRCGFQF